MPRKRGRKRCPTRRSGPHRAAAATSQKLIHMTEVEEAVPLCSSGSPSPTRSQGQQPEQLQRLKSEEIAEGAFQVPQSEPLQQPPMENVEEDETSLGAPASASSPRAAAPLSHDARAPNASAHRRPLGKRVKPLSDKQRAAIHEKLDLLAKNLRPVAFRPKKVIDFVLHEPLFRSLGLWELAHADLGGPLCPELLVQLIANYDPSARRSWVNGARVAVSRADLARSLGLQRKREKCGISDVKDSDLELFSGEESISVIMDFISNYVLLHEEDTCILPAEVMTAMRLVREGQPQKVDWCALIWTLVEKELAEAPTSGLCYYASYLQCLIRHQKPGVFEGEQEVTEVPLVEEQDSNAAATTSMDTLQETEIMDDEKPNVSLCLAPNEDDTIMKADVGESQGNEKHRWFSGPKDVNEEPYLRHCIVNAVPNMNTENVVKEESSMEDGGHYVDDITTKLSTDLLQVVDTVDASYCLPLQPMEHTSGEFLISTVDPVKGVESDIHTSSPALFKMTGKREIDEVDDDDDDEGDGISGFPHGNHHKRMRTDEQWDQTSLTIVKCMEEAQAWMGKAKMLYSQRDQEFVSTRMHIEYVTNLLQQRDHQIELMERTRLEEQQRRQIEICRFEHELGVMARIIQGYRKALMETRRAFSEYRKQFPQGDEQLYKDDDDGGGLVLTVREIEKKRLLKEEAKRLVLQMIDDFSKMWSGKFHDHAGKMDQLDQRLIDLMGKISVLKKSHAKKSSSDGKE